MSMICRLFISNARFPVYPEFISFTSKQRLEADRISLIADEEGLRKRENIGNEFKK